MQLFSIAPGLPFLPLLARGTLERLGSGEALAAATILLPTRRAARALQAAFLREARADALLLPRMRPLAGLSVEDADELSLPALLDLPPAVEPLRRQAVLAGFAARYPGHAGGPPTAEHAWALGGELARLFDEIALEEAEPIDPRHPERLTEAWLARLDGLAPERLATHWQITTLFLRGAAREWQSWLERAGLLDIGLRRVLALAAQRDAWENAPPGHAVIAAGIGLGGTIPAAAALLRTIATRLPGGAVVLVGEDPATAALPADALEAAPTHPFAGQRALLALMGARPQDAQPWSGEAPPPRAALLGTALLPAGHLEPWRRRAPGDWTPALEGVGLLQAADAQQEAAAIALALRGALEQPRARAALVTPDRDLARRVAAELPRHGIVADDSAGQPLSDTPPGVFLRLLAGWAAAPPGPVGLLSLLKHPLCAAGMERGAFLAAVRRLELTALRGPAPAPGLAGLRGLGVEGSAPLLDALEEALGDMPAMAAAGPQPPAALLESHLRAAEALATTPELPGGLRLYAQAEGEALARHLAALAAALEEMGPLDPADYPGLFEALLTAGTTRAPRVARGREDAARGSQVEILGLLEARLLDFDLMVLGALDETIWPQASDPGPWMSRPMRQAFGLPSPEGRIGRVAADFLHLAAGPGRALLTRAARRGGSPTVPARWLTRLGTFLGGQGLALPTAPEGGWAGLLDAPARIAPCPRPAPNPPLAARPRRLTVSDVARLLADPYAFHAQRVLGLKPLDPLEQEPGAADYGMLVHEAMRRFLATLPPPPAWPGDDAALEAWRVAMGHALGRAKPRPGVAAIWAPRLERIGALAVEWEARDRQDLAQSWAEVKGRISFPDLGGLALEARADRLDLLAGGGLRIVDHKTGTVPSATQVRRGDAPQLPLEALIAVRGGFQGVPAGEVAALEYWKLTGALDPGEAKRLEVDLAEAMAAAEAGLARLARRFLLAENPFIAHPHPRRRAAGDYAHLARIAEWSAGEGDEA